MKFLIIDDDRWFTKPLIWYLKREGHEVTYCQYVGEVLDGWYEITQESLAGLSKGGMPSSVIDQLKEIMSDDFATEDSAIIRFATSEDFSGRLQELLPKRQFGEHKDKILEVAKKDVFGSSLVPNCIILDIKMPRGKYYTRQQTNAGADTGIVLLGDIIKHNGWANIPVLVVTVRAEEVELVRILYKRFGNNVKGVLPKPTSPEKVLVALSEILPDLVLQGKD